MGKSTFSVPLGTTAYYKWTGKVVSTYSGSSTMYVNSKIAPFLLNKVGDWYPGGYKDKQSGIKLWYPPCNLVPNQTPDSSTYRTNFMRYYESNWGAPRYFDWTDVEIHHMSPLQYGGSHDVSNLIPLNGPKGTSDYLIRHNYLTQWWRYY